jgi:hypothetical protein
VDVYGTVATIVNAKRFFRPPLVCPEGDEEVIVFEDIFGVNHLGFAALLGFRVASPEGPVFSH